jgi:hypothetical protein
MCVREGERERERENVKCRTLFSIFPSLRREMAVIRKRKAAENIPRGSANVADGLPFGKINFEVELTALFKVTEHNHLLALFALTMTLRLCCQHYSSLSTKDE